MATVNAPELFDLSVQEVTLKLHSMVEEILFGANPWPPKPIIVNAALDKLGLEECVGERTFRLSHLGKEVDADLFRIWLGGFEPYDALWTKARGLASGGFRDEVRGYARDTLGQTVM